MTVTIQADGCRLSVKQPILADGTAGAVRVQFVFSADWSGLMTTAVFRTPRGDILMPLADGACDLPFEAMEKCGSVPVGVFGTDGTRTLTSTFCRLQIAPGVPTTGEQAANYTPGLYELFAAKIRKLENMTADAVAGETARVEIQETDDALHLHFTIPQGGEGMLYVRPEVDISGDGNAVTSIEMSETDNVLYVVKDRTFMTEEDVRRLIAEVLGSVQLATYGIENGMLVLTYSGDAADASLDVDAESGMLSVTVPDSYSGATFTLENGYLEVNTNG